MKTVTSVSGGRTSAYLADNYPSDALVFALVRIEDNECRFPDESLRRRVEDRIQKPFTGTAEDDTIIYTILDLEQYLGKEITWVSGPTFESVIQNGGGWLPNKLHRYCTSSLKIEPIFYWWANTFGIDNPVEMNIGYRANEVKRANKMLSRCNSSGLLEQRATLQKHPNGHNKWVNIPWQKPRFRLIEDNIYRGEISKHWKDKPVRFAEYNNCVGCFNREPLFLRYQFDQHPKKMRWFERQEGGKKYYWIHPSKSYEKISKLLPQMQFSSADFSPCDSGACEI